MRIKLANFIPLNISALKNSDASLPSSSDTIRERSKVIQSIKTRLNNRRSPSEKLANTLVRWFGSIGTGVIHIFGFTAWIVINTHIIPGIVPFDPYPFILLTMIVSLEAIFLSIFVLMSQNRESRVSELREEIDIQINMIAEQEITKTIRLLSYLMKYLNVPYEKDPELKRMMKPLDMEEIRKELERQLDFSPRTLDE